jgi:hypothetical protein
VSVRFGIPNGDGSSSDVAYLKVVDGSNSSVGQAPYGTIGSLTMSLDGQPWQLYNSSTTDTDQIAINLTATCSTLSGF